MNETIINTAQPQTDGTAALAPTPEQQLAQFREQEFAISREGMDFIPSRIKVIKDACLFQDELGDTFKELVGVVVFKQKTRGYWPKGQTDDKVPECSSQDGVTGTDRQNVVHNCAECPFNVWGSGVDESGEATRGKACKEMRRLFIVQEGNLMPAMVSLPPTSIKNHDKFFSARLQKGIADVDRKVVISLRSEGSGKKTYAVAEFRMGDEVPMQERIKLAAMRSAVKAAAEKVGVTEADYEVTQEPATEDVF